MRSGNVRWPCHCLMGCIKGNTAPRSTAITPYVMNEWLDTDSTHAVENLFTVFQRVPCPAAAVTLLMFEATLIPNQAFGPERHLNRFATPVRTRMPARAISAIGTHISVENWVEICCCLMGTSSGLITFTIQLCPIPAGHRSQTGPGGRTDRHLVFGERKCFAVSGAPRRYCWRSARWRWLKTS